MTRPDPNPVNATDPSSDGLDPRAERFVEGRMSRAEREAWLASLEEEPAKVRELEELARVVETLHKAPVLEAPPNFLRDVQGRIRRRTRGRHYGITAGSRLPWEAIINAVLLFSLFVVYFFGMPTTDRRALVPIPAATFAARSTDAGTAAAVLHGLGEVSQVIRDGVTTFTVTVSEERVALAEREVALYPFLAIVAREAVDGGVRLNVRLMSR
jgi:hypothetical protein